MENLCKNADQNTENSFKKTKKDKALAEINAIHKFNGKTDMQQAVEQIVLYRLKQKNIIN